MRTRSSSGMNGSNVCAYFAASNGLSRLYNDYFMFALVHPPSSRLENLLASDLELLHWGRGVAPAFASWSFRPSDQMVENARECGDWEQLLVWVRNSPDISPERRRDLMAWLWGELSGDPWVTSFIRGMRVEEDVDRGARELILAVAHGGAGRDGDDGGQELQGAGSEEEVG